MVLANKGGSVKLGRTTGGGGRNETFDKSKPEKNP